MAFWAQPLNDREVVDLFEEAHRKFPEVSGSLRAGNVNFTLANFDSENLKLLKRNSGYSVRNFDLAYGRTSFSYQRENEKGSPLAKLELNSNQNAKPATDEFQFSLFVLKKLGNPPPGGDASDPSNLNVQFVKIETVLAGAVDVLRTQGRSTRKTRASARPIHMRLNASRLS
jgi:hypothetical protein